MPKEQSENNPNKKIINGKEYFYNQKNYNSSWYEKNKDKLLIKIICENCGSQVRKSGISAHKKSKYCSLISNIKKTI